MTDKRNSDRLLLWASLILLLAVLGGFAAIAGPHPQTCRGVGFRVPPGTTSRANTDRPQIINLGALPWGPSGDDATLGHFAMPFSERDVWFRTTFQARYGAARPEQPIPDASGMHHTDYQSALEQIAARNPGWFAASGLGHATGCTQPSFQEIFDAQYAWSIHRRVLEEGKRLFDLDVGGAAPAPATLPKPNPAPTPAPPAAPLGHVIRDCSGTTPGVPISAPPPGWYYQPGEMSTGKLEVRMIVCRPERTQ